MLNGLRRVLGVLGEARLDNQMSEAWLREKRHASTRIDFQGPAMQWPVQKQKNETGWFNRQQLRREA